MDRMRAAWAARQQRLPRDHGHLSLLDASMPYLRQFAPDVLAAVRFAGGAGTDELLRAVSILAELYATGARGRSRPGSCRPSGPATFPRRPRPGTSPRTSITARAMSRYFARGQGVSVYTHVSDQHSTLIRR